MSRRLMYWQVYLHKTAVAAEKMLIKTLTRAKQLTDNGKDLFASPAFHYFLLNKVDKDFFKQHRSEVLDHFVNLDDNDIWCSLKVWASNEDTVLSKLSACLVNRNLFKIEITNEPLNKKIIQNHINQYMTTFNINAEDASFFCSADVIYTNMYNEVDDNIGILYNDGSIKDISEASDMLNIQLLSKKVEKYYFSYLKIE